MMMRIDGVLSRGFIKWESFDSADLKTLSVRNEQIEVP